MGQYGRPNLALAGILVKKFNRMLGFRVCVLYFSEAYNDRNSHGNNSATNYSSVFTRNSIYAIARICHGNSVCPSVCLSVRHMDGSVKNG